jgi:Beta-lactamase class C and other penicillin binding proteins
MRTESNKLSDKVSTKLTERIQRVESGLPSIPENYNLPPLQLTLQKLMELYKIPGLSIAVIDNFEIVWAKGYGMVEAGGTNPVTTQTLFQAGSVSKPVAAIGALSLVEQGNLSLDEDVNEKLVSWKVSENEFTRDQKVTLRRLQSHTAGLTTHFFPGYSVDDPIPTLIEILNGEKPANTAPVYVDFVPGSKWRYSGGGTLIEQQLMIDVTGKPFPKIMQETVFDRVGMIDSSYEQPLPSKRTRMAASGTYWNGEVVPGKWHIYPEMAAAGLWSTPSDLSKLAIEIALSKQGKSNRVLSKTITHEMLKPQMDRVEEMAFGDQQHPDRMGLGFFLGDETRPDLFGHIGDDAGFQAMLIMYSDSGQGAVIMANSQLGILLGDCLIENIAHEYGWKTHSAPNRPHLGAPAVLMVLSQLENTQTALKQYQVLKDANLPRYAPDENTLLIFGYSLLADKKTEDAIEALKLEVHEYPGYWNGYDTLAEVYAALGEKQLAIQNYEKSVEINPDNQNAVENIKKLTERG